MKDLHTSPSVFSSQLAVERLTALWALNEAALGGILHAFRIPFVGLLVGGIAIVLVSLIAHTAEKKFSSILKATLIVLIIKAAVSPHSPPGAYFAVGFQGFIGAIIYRIIPHFRIAAMLFAMLAFVETACQRLITMTLLFGRSIWEAIDAFVDQVFQQLGIQAEGISLHASYWLVGLYLGIYLLGGLLVGWWAGHMPQSIRAVPLEDARRAWQTQKPETTAPKEKKPRSAVRKWLFPGILLLFVVLMTWHSPQLAGGEKAIYVLIRSLLIIALWYLVFAPLGMKLLRRFLSRKQGEYSHEVNKALAVLPAMRKLAQLAWQRSAQKQGLSRIHLFLTSLIAYSLAFRGDEQVDVG